MNIVAELHTHTLASGHAFNTITEMFTHARQLGLKAMAVTDHAPGTCDTLSSIEFNCFRYLPRQIEGLYIISGVEVNIMDFDGNVDLEDAKLDKLDFRIASKHEPLDMNFKSRWGNKEENTCMYLNIAKNPKIDCFGHLCNTVVPFEYEPVVKAAAENGKIIELNVSYPKRSQENTDAAIAIMKLCKQYGVQTAVTTDAHSIYVLGENQIGIDILDSIDYPEELVINSSMERLTSYFENKMGRNIFLDKMCL